MEPVPDWIRDRLRKEGFSICCEWSQASELGQVYVVTSIHNKNSSRIPAKCLEYFLIGICEGKSCQSI